MIRQTAIAVGLCALVVSAAAADETILLGSEVLQDATLVSDNIGRLVEKGTPEFRGAVGFYYVRPQWDQNVSHSSFTFDPALNSGRNALTSFDYDFSFSPRVWASYVNPTGMGLRWRYWQFDQGMNQQAIDEGAGVISTAAPLGVGFVSMAGAGNSSVLNFNSDLKLYAIDLDFTKDIQIGRLALLYWGGFRYAHISQDYSAGEFLQDGTSQSLTSGHNVNGFGPTVGLEDRYAMGDSGLSLFGNIRGSLLFGNGKQVASRESFVQGSLSASDSRNDLLPIGELEVGGEFKFDVGPAKVFVQLALVGQVWYGVGNSSRSNGAAAPAFAALPDMSSVADSNLGLYGLTTTVGVNW